MIDVKIRLYIVMYQSRLHTIKEML